MPLAGGILGRASGQCFVAGTQVVMAEQPGFPMASMGMVGANPGEDGGWWQGIVTLFDEHRATMGIACVVVGVGVGGVIAYRTKRRQDLLAQEDLVDAVLGGDGIDNLVGWDQDDMTIPWSAGNAAVSGRRSRLTVTV
jgi:hypothetical protein